MGEHGIQQNISGNNSTNYQKKRQSITTGSLLAETFTNYHKQNLI